MRTMKYFDFDWNNYFDWNNWDNNSATEIADFRLENSDSLQIILAHQTNDFSTITMSTNKYFGVFIWINDDQVTGNVLNLTNIVEPRKPLADYKEKDVVKAKCPGFGLQEGVLGRIAGMNETILISVNYFLYAIHSLMLYILIRIYIFFSNSGK